MNKPELLPCPFCGKQPEKFGLADAYRCECISKNGGWKSLKDWNHRTDPGSEGLREALESAIRYLENLGPEPPDHSCVPGITPCDGLCADYASFSKTLDGYRKALAATPSTSQERGRALTGEYCNPSHWTKGPGGHFSHTRCNCLGEKPANQGEKS